MKNDVKFINRTGMVYNEDEKRYEYWLVMKVDYDGISHHRQELIAWLSYTKGTDIIKILNWCKTILDKLETDIKVRVNNFTHDVFKHSIGKQ